MRDNNTYYSHPGVIETKKVTLKDIEDAAYIEFQRRVYNAINSNARAGIFHVSDYVNPCMRNAYYAHMGAQRLAQTPAQAATLFAGEAVHQLLDGASHPDQGETPLAWNIVRGLAVREQIAEIGTMKADDWMECIVGEADALYHLKIFKELTVPVIVDYKTYNSEGNPRKRKLSIDPVHRNQINTYKFLFDKCENINIRYGAVIYLDFADRFANPLIFPFETESSEKMWAILTQKQAQFMQAYRSGTLPDRTVHWKCKAHCPWAQRCFSEEELSDDEKTQLRVGT